MDGIKKHKDNLIEFSVSSMCLKVLWVVFLYYNNLLVHPTYSHEHLFNL